MSTLVCGKIGMKFVKLFRTGGCCSALVQAVCVHYLGDDRASNGEEGQEDKKRLGKGRGLGQPISSLLLLQNILKTICDLVDCNRIDLSPIDYTEICDCRSSLIMEGAHEAIALLMRTHNVNATAYTDCISNIGTYCTLVNYHLLHIDNCINKDCIQRTVVVYFMYSQHQIIDWLHKMKWI